MDLNDIRELLAEYGIKFIRLAFCDIAGRQKNIAIMADELEHAVTHGVSFDASAIKGFLNISESDLLLFPDLDTFSVLPWRPSERGVARFYCYITYPDRRPFEGDGRYLLSQIERRSLQAGYSFLVGPECEFYLFRTDEKGFPTLEPFDEAGYFDMAPLDRGENVRREICFALEDMGLKPERSHHEHGPGQNEIDFRCSSPLKAADDLMTFKTAVKAIAQQHGLSAGCAAGSGHNGRAQTLRAAMRAAIEPPEKTVEFSSAVKPLKWLKFKTLYIPRWVAASKHAIERIFR